MSYDVRILADSTAQGVRLTTVQATYPRIIHSEVMTHRMLSRNAASSRAIPVEKSIARVLADPFFPEAFGANKKGMQGGEALDDEGQRLARENWKIGLNAAVKAADGMAELGVHKHWANRLLEPYSWITTVITATEWENFFALRCHKDAAPEFQKIAGMLREAMFEATPRHLEPGQWHLPMVFPADYDECSIEGVQARRLFGVKLSVARCARVSYLTHEGKRDVAADLALYGRLRTSGHLSPLEHAARVATCEDGDRCTTVEGEPGMIDPPHFVGNLRWPWIQHRKLIEGEAVFHG